MKILCIGRNYRDHAMELGNTVPTEPVVFCKPDSAILQPNFPFTIPPWSNDIHHEVEWVIKIGRVGKFIEPEFAWSYVDSMTVGIDFTARDLQSKLKENGLPWEKAKGFDGSAVLGTWIPGPISQGHHSIALEKNGHLVQAGNTVDFIFPLEELIAHVSQYFTLKTGDLLFTGTPAGVGPVSPGDELEAKLDGKSLLRLRIR
ncbi:MAG: 2-hydroxyhepta-2,4-diene-1,7-dioate isomerase [Cryomorphaceae bacterium BACL7 MAG-120910-bin2]|jgi:2-keto-4-pentenoate hydratase/2-oxohepta-3-ene-1,7-dioic acid hydratase in catechol pathway|nr:MAG: 2-hydroxyhepta-2,4-diene-1,7-dioate isomerase [Cryomorphaceae bacterium BACL7 MAG-120910-bin2]KRO68292.1 MAG: 2-hydroxyhepta-2,4-diene-1,7-dioate isomerase [Cryomorphaceae bacterium BACL7 MAG-120322-bin74]|tara:strand:- start:2183 stop:2788 length:606 start_codon:yes stop_codon:yes gene_type:complete